MELKIYFTDDTERDAIIKAREAQGYRLLEEARHFDGNYLIFTDEPPELSLEEWREQIDQRVKNLELRGP